MPFIGDNGKNTKTPNTGAAGSDKPLIKSVQQAASDAPKAPRFLSTYTLKLNNGSTYELTQSQMDWVKNRYQSTVAEAKDYDFSKTYRDTTLDKKLLSAGLPSEKYIEKFISAYSDWYGDGQSYSFDGGMKNTIASKFKSSWEYEYTLEDQKRKAAGQMPLAIEAKYGDNRRDYELMQQGLPPEAMLSDYVGAFEKVEYETAKKNQLYDTATIKIMEAEAALGGYQKLSDAERIKIFDSVFSGSEYDDIRGLYEPSPADTTGDGTIDSLEELDKKWKNADKKQSDEPTVSWSDFIGGYEKRKSGVLVDQAAYDTAIAETKKQTTASLTNKDEVRQYVDERSTDKATDILDDMYGARLSIGRIREAKDYLFGKATTKEEKDAIRAKIGEIADAYTRDQYSASENADRLDGSTRARKQAGDSAVKDGVVKQYDQGATSTINADDAEKIFKSHLVYDDKGKATKESIELATNMMYEAGATTSVVLEVGKRAGMKSNFLSKYYWENQLAIEQQATQEAFDQTSGFQAPKVVEENKPRYDIKGFDQVFADVVAERDLAQRKELIDASYKANVERGNMTSADFYNAVRRAGWGDTIDVAKDAEAYYNDVYAPKFAKNGEQLPKWEEIDQAAFIANFESGKDLNPEIHKTAEEIAQGSLSRAFMAPAMEIAKGTIGFLDMATAKASGRTEAWELTNLYSDVSQKSEGVSSNQSVGSQAASISSTVAGQLVRMYTVSQIGSGVLSMFSKGASAVAGAVSQTNAGNILSQIAANATPAMTKGASALVKGTKWLISSSPFIATSMGSSFTEAIQDGASIEQATLYGVVCGAMEGALEAVGTELWLGRMFGGQSVAKGIISAGKAAFKSGAILPKALMIRLVSSTLGNALEEGASYAVSIGMQKATYNKDAQFDWTEAGNQALMGGLIGLLGAGMNAGADTQSNILAEFMNSKAGQEWLADDKNNSAFTDIFVISTIADTVPDQARSAMRMQENAKSVSDVSAMVRDIDQHSRQMDAGQKQYDIDIAKIDSELGKKQSAVSNLATRLEQLATDKSPFGMKKWAKFAEQLQVAQSELDVEQAQADAKRTERTAAFTETTEQHKIAISKAQDSLKGVAVSIAEAFNPTISTIRSLVRDNVQAVPNDIAMEIVTKMDAARAGKLFEYVQTKNTLQQQYESVKFPTAQSTSPAEPLGVAQGVQAPTVQPTAVDAPASAQQGDTVQSGAVDGSGNIKSEATPANPAETMGIVDPKLQETVNAIRKLGRGAYKYISSGTMGVERFANRVQKKLDVGGADANDLAQGVRSAIGISQGILSSRLIDINGNEIGGSLVSVFKPIPAELESEFNLYAIARHNAARMTLEERGYGKNKPVLASETEVDADGNPAPMSATESAALVQKIEAAHPEFAQTFEGYKSWWKSFMQSWAVDGGLMSKELFLELQTKYPDYVPTNRTEKKGAGLRATVTNSSVVLPSAIRTAKGSTSEIQDIRQSLANLVERYVAMERFNELVQSIYNTAETHVDATAEYAEIIDEDTGVPADVDFHSFDELALQGAAEVKDGAYVIRGWRDGERISMAVNQDVYESLNYLLPPRDTSMFAKASAAIQRGFRTATKPIKSVLTGINPAFGLRNPIRDVQTYFMYTEAPAIKSIENLGRAVGERVGKSARWKNYEALSGGSAGFVSGQFVDAFKAETGSKTWRGVKKAAKTTGAALSSVGKFTESIPRFAEYLNGIDKYGDTPDGRRKAIQMAADVTVNFSRSAAVTKAVDSACIYFNANVQGLDKLARQIAKSPVKTIARGMTLAGIHLLLRYLLRHQENPHYQNLSEFVKDTNFLIPNVFGERDANGYCTTFIKLPNERGLGMALIATVERFARWAEGESAESAFADLGENILTNFAVEPNPFWAFLGTAKTNKNWYGGDIVPMYMQDEAAPDQTNAQTSVIADAISERLYEMGKEVSPMVIDYQIEQGLGNFYGKLLTASTAKDSNGILNAAGNITESMFVADPLYQSGVVSRFYDTMDEAQHLARSSQRNREKFGISATSKDEAGYENLDGYKKQIAKLRKQEREIMANELDTPERKAKIDAIREEINRVATDGIAAWNGR